jgi:hypothetical protein
MSDPRRVFSSRGGLGVITRAPLRSPTSSTGDSSGLSHCEACREGSGYAGVNDIIAPGDEHAPGEEEEGEPVASAS